MHQPTQLTTPAGTLVTDAQSLAMQRGSMSVLAHLVAGAAPGSTLWARNGVLASIVPSAPRQLLANLVTATPAHAVVPELDNLAAQYEQAGVRAWRVWIDSDPATEDALVAAGYVRTEDYPAISIDPREFDPIDFSELNYDVDGDMDELGYVNQVAFDEGAQMSKVLVRRPVEPELRIYRARWHGDIVSAFAAMDYLYPGGRGCALHLGGVLPHARGNGVWKRLFSAALVDARDRGCVSVNCQASPMGMPIYEKLGFKTQFHFRTYVRCLP